MSRQGDRLGLLHDLHADGCDGQEHSSLRPVVVPSEDPTYYDRDRGAEIQVVFMAWCGECGAADWGVV